MKQGIFILTAFVLVFAACRKEYHEPEQKGNPVITPVDIPQSGHFGDSLPFTIGVGDNEIALSQLKLQLLFGETKVSEFIVRTKEAGNYSGKIPVPFLKDIPNGTATLRVILQNITTKTTVLDLPLPLTRPQFPYITLVMENGDTARLLPTANDDEYGITGTFPLKIKGYFKAPKAGANGNEITFGVEGGQVEQNSTGLIDFSSLVANYTVVFNTYSYRYGPAVRINDVPMVQIVSGPYANTGGNYQEQYYADVALSQEDSVKFDDFDDLDNWWIDPDFFSQASKTTLVFKAQAGKYRILANFVHHYIYAELMQDNDLAVTGADGGGTVWVIGEGIGKPSATANETAWTTEKGLCMAPIGDKKYRITGIVGKTLKPTINFKFFYQKGWGGEFYGSANTDNKGIISSTGTLIEVALDGNIKNVAGQTLKNDSTYIFIVDLSEGLTSAKLTVKQN
jgi:hypothetical protein